MKSLFFVCSLHQCFVEAQNRQTVNSFFTLGTHFDLLSIHVRQAQTEFISLTYTVKDPNYVFIKARKNRCNMQRPNCHLVSKASLNRWCLWLEIMSREFACIMLKAHFQLSGHKVIRQLLIYFGYHGSRLAE